MAVSISRQYEPTAQSKWAGVTIAERRASAIGDLLEITVQVQHGVMLVGASSTHDSAENLLAKIDMLFDFMRKNVPPAVKLGYVCEVTVATLLSAGLTVSKEMIFKCPASVPEGWFVSDA